MNQHRPIAVASRNLAINHCKGRIGCAQVRPCAYSMPPVESKDINFKTNEENFNYFQTNNIALLTRGISLLSIAQLREFLREYSLPTGGNKQILANRLIIYLETFGQNQPNLLANFSIKLKKILSLDDETQQNSHSFQGDDSETKDLPGDVKKYVMDYSPSCLFEEAKDLVYPFSPFIFSANSKDDSNTFVLTEPPTYSLPILQFIPYDYNSEIKLKSVTFKIENTLITLKDGLFWYDLSEFENQKNHITILEVEPKITIIMVIKWMRTVSFAILIKSIITEREAAPIIKSTKSKPNGICPLTNKIITRPTRGVNCKHSECFDLSGYLCYATKNKSWICPICNKTVAPEDLRIDPNFFKIVSFQQN